MRLSSLFYTIAFHLRGIYQIIHPIRKMVRFTENNHYLSQNFTDIIFTRHPIHRQRFRIHNLTNDHLLLINTENTSDYILIHPLIG